MIPHAQEGRETKILADILALVLDEQAGLAEAALDNIRHRAQADGVSGGALKEVFLRLRGADRGDGRSGPDLPPAGAGDDVLHMALTRSRISISELQSQVAFAEHQRRDEQRRFGIAVRQARLVAAASGVLAGVGIGFLASSAVTLLTR